MNKVKEKIKKMWAAITASKLNIGIFAAGLIVFALSVSIFIIIILRGGEIDNTIEIKVTKEVTTPPVTTADNQNETTKPDEKDTQSEEYSTKIDENATQNVAGSPTLLKVSLETVRRWQDDGEYYVQYNIEVNNISGQNIDGWALVLDMAGPYELVDSWNFTFKEGYKKLIINPSMDNKRIKDDDSVRGGFTVKAKSYVSANYYTSYVGRKSETIKNNSYYVPENTTTVRPTENDTTTRPTSEPETKTPRPSESVTPKETDETTTPEETDSTTTTVSPIDDTTTTTTEPQTDDVPKPPVDTETTTPSETVDTMPPSGGAGQEQNNNEREVG